MKWIGGKFHGTGDSLYICCGFVPDAVKIVNVEAATPLYLFWNRHMADASQLSIEGVYRAAAGGALGDLAAGAGIQPYYGGDLLTTTSAGTTTYGEGVYLKEDRRDYRFWDERALLPGDGALGDITDWTLDAVKALVFVCADKRLSITIKHGSRYFMPIRFPKKRMLESFAEAIIEGKF